MTRNIITTTIAVALATGCVVGEEGQIATPEADNAALETHVADHYIAVLRPDVGAGIAGQINWSDIDGVVEVSRYSTLNVFTFRGPPSAALEIANRSEVAYVEPDQIVALSLPGWCKWVPEHPLCQEDGSEPEPPADPDKPSWCVHLPDHPLCADDPGAPGGGDDQETPWGVTRVGGSLGASGRTAWVIDTGVDLDHADLNLDLAMTKNFVSTENITDDTNGHGTHVAGTIAAIDNGLDVVGVAAGNVVVGVRVLDTNGSGAISDIVAGIDYVAQNGSPGDVANMSLGGKGESQAMEDAIKRATDLGIQFAIAAGNDGADASDYTPASIDTLGAVTVSAIGENDCLASFSNYGAPVDVAAPGVDVVSLANGGGTRPLSGTSMAAPHVAGLLLHDSLNSDGTICGDKDGTPDPIAHR